MILCPMSSSSFAIMCIISGCIGGDKHCISSRCTMADAPWQMHQGRWTMAAAPGQMQQGRCSRADAPWQMHHGRCTVADAPWQRHQGRCTRADAPWQGALLLHSFTNANFVMPNVNTHGCFAAGKTYCHCTLSKLISIQEERLPATMPLPLPLLPR